MEVELKRGKICITRFRLLLLMLQESSPVLLRCCQVEIKTASPKEVKFIFQFYILADFTDE